MFGLLLTGMAPVSGVRHKLLPSISIASASAKEWEGYHQCYEPVCTQVIVVAAEFSKGERITDHSNANVAVDFYHRYKEDVQRMKEMGMDAFRFSISWSRVLPRIQPYVTLFHWDTPEALEDKYGGF
ncbi:unnamed protein product [Dovyalis caffra]|uniref:Beta-glucosidase n=1 Tax=Dovyalis caffra TaxID=77055 RepID=A0AAV1RDB1_9ROSI|nr:unnamed protein product [Dovyalis caffra]